MFTLKQKGHFRCHIIFMKLKKNGSNIGKKIPMALQSQLVLVKNIIALICFLIHQAQDCMLDTGGDMFFLIFMHVSNGLQGYNVLHPMGWDAFGLPAENDAIKKGKHPQISTAKNIATFKEQLQANWSYL